MSISRPLIDATHTAGVQLKTSPIASSWIIAGNPVAQSTVLSKSADGLAWTMVWQCTEGKFNWYYDLDETILILKGSIVLKARRCPLPATVPVTSSSSGMVARYMACGRLRTETCVLPEKPAASSRLRLRASSKIKRTLLPARHGFETGLYVAK